MCFVQIYHINPTGPTGLMLSSEGAIASPVHALDAFAGSQLAHQDVREARKADQVGPAEKRSHGSLAVRGPAFGSEFKEIDDVPILAAVCLSHECRARRSEQDEHGRS